MSDAPDDHPLTGPFGVIVALFSVAVIVFAWLWLIHPGVVVSLTLAIRGAELRALSVFDPRYADLARSLHARDPRTIGLLNLYNLSALVGRVFNRIVAAAFGVLSSSCCSGRPASATAASSTSPA